MADSFSFLWTIAGQAPLSMGFPRQELLKWVARPSSRGPSRPRDRTQVSCFVDGFFYLWATREALNRYSYLWPPLAKLKVTCGDLRRLILKCMLVLLHTGRMVRIKKIVDAKPWWALEQLRPSRIARGVAMVQPLWEVLWQFLIELNM